MNMRNSIQNKTGLMNPIITKPWAGLKLLLATVLWMALSYNSQAQSLVAQFGTDTSVCPNSASRVYNISPAAGAWTFSLPNGGGTIASSSATSVTINWGSVGGTFYVRATDGFTVLLRSVVVEGDLALACDDLVNVSLNDRCEALITPSVVIEGSNYPDDSYAVTVYNTDGSIIPGNLVNYSHLGKKLRVHVRHICSGITCWGYIFIEDKFIPNLTCRTADIRVNCSDDVSPASLGFPVPPSATITPVVGDNKCFTVRGFDLCCDVELCYFDIYTKYGCNQPNYAQYDRTWVAKDCKGNTTTCKERILVQQSTLLGIVCPPNFDGFTNPALNCDDKEPASGPYPSGWNALDNGNPSPYDYVNAAGQLIWRGTGYPLNVNCDHLAVSYRDLKIPICGNSIKIFRNWKIFDWCTGQYIECNQLIKVADHKAPIIACSNNYQVFPMDYYSCTGTATVSGPDLILDCSPTTLAVSFKKAGPDGTPEDGDFRTDGVTYLGGGKVRISGLPADTSWVRYTVTDACGNETRCVVEVIIEDNLDPVAVCDEHTVVSLGDSGVAKIFAASLDQGSFDNCAVDSVLVRRMSDNCNILGNTTFGPFVKFCCEDVQQSPIMVALRVIDKNGNFNDCMVLVTVQDKISPDITCPKDVIVSCTTDIYNFANVGQATAVDNCPGIKITYKDDSTGFKCATGVINRRWRAEDPGGRFDLCDQKITIVDPNPLTFSQISWPGADITVAGCKITDADPNLINSFPRWAARPCANIIRGYDDEKFYNVENFCIKIIRHWRVIDWCQYDVNSQTPTGVWTFDQIIKVQNTRPPTIDPVSCGVKAPVCAQGSACSAFVDLYGYATDDCTDTTSLKWSYTIDFDNNGSVEVTGNTKNASGTYQRGTHRVRWSVTDLCGNTGTCDQIFSVKDCKAPTPFCKAGLITVVMSSNGSVTVKAIDFNEKSEDNCTAKPKLKYSFTANVNDTARTFRCSDIPNGISRDTSVRIYVTDEDGNQEFCITTLTLQDNTGNACPNRLTNGGTVSGLISANTNAPLKNATIELKKLNSKMGEINTPDEGLFTFLDLPFGESYDLAPYKNDDPANGVSTADIVMIQKHILGQQTFDSPYKYIAADANNSGTITAADISELRKLVLGVSDKFKNNQKSWRFIQGGFKFEDETNPWLNNGWPEFIHVDNLQGEVKDNNFMAIKIGDINYTAKTNLALASQSRTAGRIYFELEDKSLLPGDQMRIPVFGSWNNRISGFQLSWKYNPNVLEVVSVQSGQAIITEGNYSLLEGEKGILSMSWNGNDPIKASSNLPLFYIIVKSNHTINPANDFTVANSGIEVEAYTDELEILDIQLRDRSSHKELVKFELFQNTPNPFGDKTNIAFYTPVQSSALIKIHDLSGRLLLVKQIKTSVGVNNVQIDQNEFSNHSGVYYYTLETSEFVATKKMILSK